MKKFYEEFMRGDKPYIIATTEYIDKIYKAMSDFIVNGAIDLQ